MKSRVPEEQTGASLRAGTSDSRGIEVSSKRDDSDIFRLAPTLDETTIETLVNRLEFRGTDEGYVNISQGYFQELPLASARRILALGCGTGVEVRALKRRAGTSVDIIGVDHSPALIDAAEWLTRDEGISEGVQYQVGDAHELAFEDGSFDIVTLHTLISHVDSPLQVLREARRVVRPGGTIAIFDGGYASLTFGYSDPGRATEIENALLKVIVANPGVMRDLPRLVGIAELELVNATGVVYADIGAGSFFVNVPAAQGTVLNRSGLLPAAVIEEWIDYQASAAQENRFFGASNYYTYLVRRPR